MALSGTLQEFGAAEALGLVAREEKSGRMELSLPSGQYALYFDKGKLIQARPGKPAVDDTFFAMLREMAVVPKEGWRELTTWQEDHPNDDPVLFFIDRGYATREQFEEWLIVHTQGALDEVLEATQGSFEFESIPLDHYAVALSEQVEFMIMEAGRRVDEAKEMMARELVGNAVPSIRPGGRPAPSDLVQAAVLRRIDGLASIQEILDAMPIPKYDVLSPLKQLVQDSAVVLRIPGGSAAAATHSSGAGQAAKQFGVIVAAIAIVILSAAAGLTLWGVSLPFIP